MRCSTDCSQYLLSLAAASQVLSLPQAPPALSVLLGSVTHGAYLTSPSHVVHSGMGAIKLAPVDASLPTLTDPGHQAARDRLGLKDQQLAASHCSMPPAVAHGCSAAGMSEGGTAGAGGETSGGRVGQDLVQARAGGSCLLQQLLGVRSLATELVPDHHSFMQQVGDDNEALFSPDRALGRVVR